MYAVDPRFAGQKAGLKEEMRFFLSQGKRNNRSDYNEILNIISESKGIPLDFEIRRPHVEAQTIGSGKNQIRSGQILHFGITPVEEKGRVIMGFVPDYPSDLQKFGLWSLRAIDSSQLRHVLIYIQNYRQEFHGNRLREDDFRTDRDCTDIRERCPYGQRSVFFGFLGLVSLQLGVFNLLPIPILDGGVIALLLIEGLIGRDLSLNQGEDRSGRLCFPDPPDGFRRIQRSVEDRRLQPALSLIR